MDISRIPYEKIISELVPTYRSIEIRFIIIKNKDGKWVCPLFIFRPTNKTKDEIKNIHDTLLNNLGKRETEKFKIKFTSIDVGEIFEMLRQIESGEIKINGNLIKFVYSEKREWQIYSSSYAPLLVNDERFKSISLNMNFNISPLNLLNEIIREPLSIGLKNFDEICFWLNLHSFTTSLNIFGSFPIYSQITDIKINEDEIMEISGFIHEKLKSKCKLWISRDEESYSRQRLLFRRIVDIDNGKQFDEEYIKFTNYIKLNLEDPNEGGFKVEIIHELLGEIDIERIDLSKYFEPPSPLLLPILNNFEGIQNLNDYLMKDGKSLESAVHWLLEIIGFHTLKLSHADNKNKAEKILSESIPGISGDIFAWTPDNKNLLLIECVGGDPTGDHDKVNRAANEIERKMEIKLLRVLITSVETPDAKRRATDMNVLLLDKGDLLQLYQYLISGQFNEAKSYILSELDRRRFELENHEYPYI